MDSNGYELQSGRSRVYGREGIYKAPMTTAILRFQLSEDMMNEKIIELSKGKIASIYYYTQLLFLGMKDKIVWKD